MKTILFNLLISLFFFIYLIFQFINKDAGNFGIVIGISIFFVIQAIFIYYFAFFSQKREHLSKIFTYLFLLLLVEIGIVVIWGKDLQLLIPVIQAKI